MNKINKNIKAYFFDLDGTLLDLPISRRVYKISEENINAIKKAKKDKKEIIISTGRMGPFVQNLIKKLNLDYAVTANGAIVIDNKGNHIKDDPLTIKQFLLLLDIIKQKKVCMKMDLDLIGYGVNSWFTKKMTEKFGLIPKNNYDCEMHIQRHKVIIWGKSKWKLLSIKDYILKQVPDISVVTAAHGWTLEITHINSTKGLGNLFIANKLGLKKNEIIHVGDTMNDSTTVKYMKLIAMKNASKKLKYIAHFIGPNWKNGGISKILNGEFIKNKKSKY